MRGTRSVGSRWLRGSELQRAARFEGSDIGSESRPQIRESFLDPLDDWASSIFNERTDFHFADLRAVEESMTRDTNTGRTAVIIGCGIAGPVLAMFLQRVGFTPIVYERRPEPRDEAGFFLNLAPNGLDVLDTLGIREDVEAVGTPTTKIVFQNHRGKQLAENPESTLLLKRGRITRVLREAAIDSGIAVEFGKRLTDVATDAGGLVTAHFEDGSTADGDLLVGCDGIHSRTRRSIMPDAPDPEYLGVIDSGGFTHDAPVEPSDGVFRMTFGTEAFFGYQVIPSGEVYWFENFHQSTAPDSEQLEAVSDEE